MKNGMNNREALKCFTTPPSRVVSLVPSLTESLFELGLGDALVGVTDYCVHPAQARSRLPQLGGPKDPNVEKIISLQPELVLANWEENTLGTVEAVEAAGIKVWVTFPKSVQDAMEVLWTLVGIFHHQEASLRLQMLEMTLDWTVSAASERSRVRYFCPIWYEISPRWGRWWMTFNQETYCHDLLRLLGGENVFAERVRRFPLGADLGFEPPKPAGEADCRYPRLPLEEIRLAQPDLILLPDEPYPFDQIHLELLCDELPDVPAVRDNRMHLLPGDLITWHGTRLAHALRELPPLLVSS